MVKTEAPKPLHCQNNLVSAGSHIPVLWSHPSDTEKLT